jgi:isopentenyl-diphosphate delta-isomerase
MKKDWIILVDQADREIGVMEKMEAHARGVLHRAFSIFIFNKKGEMLLQQRADDKYHSGGQWANACCSHPCPGEDISAAVHRRLSEELGFDTSLEKIFDFIYKATLENNLTEHEFDHVYAGEFDGPVVFNTLEVKAVQFLPVTEIKNQMAANPGIFTPWFRIAFPRVVEWRHHHYNQQWK